MYLASRPTVWMSPIFSAVDESPRSRNRAGRSVLLISPHQIYVFGIDVIIFQLGELITKRGTARDTEGREAVLH
jgi:hypothetical protein